MITIAFMDAFDTNTMLNSSMTTLSSSGLIIA